MKMYELQALAENYKRAFNENGMCGIWVSGRCVEMQLTKEQFIKAFGSGTKIEKLNGAWVRVKYVDDVRFVCYMPDYTLTDADKKDIEFWGCK